MVAASIVAMAVVVIIVLAVGKANMGHAETCHGAGVQAAAGQAVTGQQTVPLCRPHLPAWGLVYDQHGGPHLLLVWSPTSSSLLGQMEPLYGPDPACDGPTLRG